jgi:hypothetical protein
VAEDKSRPEGHDTCHQQLAVRCHWGPETKQLLLEVPCPGPVTCRPSCAAPGSAWSAPAVWAWRSVGTTHTAQHSTARGSQGVLGILDTTRRRKWHWVHHSTAQHGTSQQLILVIHLLSPPASCWLMCTMACNPPPHPPPPHRQHQHTD